LEFEKIHGFGVKNHEYKIFKDLEKIFTELKNICV
jgi:hypothetical protein